MTTLERLAGARGEVRSRRCASGRCCPRPRWIVAALLFALSCFHYYTAGFGLLRETTHRGIHLAFVLGPDLPRLRRDARRGNAAPPHGLALRPAACRSSTGCCAIARRGRQPLRALRSSTISRSASAIPITIDVDHGHDPDRACCSRRRAARRLAAADHRDRAAWSTRSAARSFPGIFAHPGNTLERASSTISISPARASTASRSAWSRPTSSTTCCSACWRRAIGLGRFFIDLATGAGRPLRRRPGEGVDLRLGAVRHDLRLVDRQHGDGRLADHPGDDPPRLPAAFRGARWKSTAVDRRPDHAADHGRGRVPDGRVPERALLRPSSWPRSCRPSCISSACSARCTSRPRSYGLRGLTARRAAGSRATSSAQRLADRDAARRAADRAVLGLHALSRGVLGHHLLHRASGLDQPQRHRRRCRGSSLAAIARRCFDHRPSGGHRSPIIGGRRSPLCCMRAWSAARTAARGSSTSSTPSWSARNTPSASAPRPRPSASSSAS